MKIALFLPNWLGDLVMATPMLRALRKKWGSEAHIVGIMRPYLADVLNGTDWIDEKWFFDPRNRNKNCDHGSWPLVRRMRNEQFDQAIFLTNSLRTAVAAWLGNAKQRIGYVRYGRGIFLTDKLHPRRYRGQIVPEPMVQSYLTLAHCLGCEENSPRLELATTPFDERAADEVFSRLHLPNDGRTVLLNCSGAYGAAKLWPVEYFGELARRIVVEHNRNVLVMCGPNEKHIARNIVELAENRRVCSMADQPMDFGVMKAVIRRGCLMISTDSGPRHVAAAFGLPLITMYGPMSPIWSENPTQRASNLVADLHCIGCHARVCPLKHHRCMRDITVDRVFEEVQKRLAEEKKSAA